MRLAFLCDEANKMTDAHSILACMLQIMPDSKIIEDLHGCFKKDALANSNRRNVKQVQHVITNSDILERKATAKAITNALATETALGPEPLGTSKSQSISVDAVCNGWFRNIKKDRAILRDCEGFDILLQWTSLLFFRGGDAPNPMLSLS